MSTICKLNPNVRAARTRRANVLRQMHGLRGLARDTRELMMLDAMITDLEKVAKCSWRPGLNSTAQRGASGVWVQSKEHRFRSILNHSKIKTAA